MDGSTGDLFDLCVSNLEKVVEPLEQFAFRGEVRSTHHTNVFRHLELFE